MSEEQKQQKEKKQKEKKEEESKEEPKKEVKEEAEIEVPKKFQKLVEEIEKMSVLDLAELVKILEKKFGVSVAVPIAAAVVPGGVVREGAEGAEVEEEKSSFNIELTETGGNKIGVIKALREITQKGLKECKDMTEGAPLIVKEGAKKEEAEEMKKKLEAVGAKVTLK